MIVYLQENMHTLDYYSRVLFPEQTSFQSLYCTLSKPEFFMAG